MHRRLFFKILRRFGVLIYTGMWSSGMILPSGISNFGTLSMRCSPYTPDRMICSAHANVGEAPRSIRGIPLSFAFWNDDDDDAHRCDNVHACM